MMKTSCCCYTLEYGAVVIGITFFIINSVGFLMQVSCSWILVAGKLQEPLFDTVLCYIIFHTIDIIFDNHLLFDQIHYYHGYAAKVALLAEWNDVKFNISDPGPIRHGKNNHIIPLYDK